MAAIRELCLTVLFLLFSLISGLQTNSANQKACESSNVTIAFKYSLDGDNFSDRSWFINSNTAANRIARVNSAGTFTVGLQYSGRVTLSGSDAITLHNVNKSDSGTYLFVILTAINSDQGTATTTVNVCVNPNNSCIPIIENNSTGNFTCKISDACSGKDCIQAIWDNGSVGMFTCPSVNVKTEYKCCAKVDPAANCYSGSLCTSIVCNATAMTTTITTTATITTTLITTRTDRGPTMTSSELPNKPVIIGSSVGGFVLIILIIIIICFCYHRKNGKNGKKNEADSEQINHNNPASGTGGTQNPAYGVSNLPMQPRTH